MDTRPGRLVAHTPPVGGGDWHYLDHHLREVADLAAEFAVRFGAGSIAWWIGIWHDLAKCDSAFQMYLWECFQAALLGQRPPRSKSPHAGPGASYAYRRMYNRGHVDRMHICIPIQGHHSHLQEVGESETAIHALLASGLIPLEDMHRLSMRLEAELPDGPPSIRFPQHGPLEMELFVRMLFSTLIDADRLSTEKHFDSAIHELRARRTSACELSSSLNTYIEGKRDTSTTLNRLRNEVYECCLAAAQLPSGMFRLTVPTGGGKTLSSLAFALAHLGDNDGIIVVALPYTSIIEQTAKEYRKVPGIGTANVLEHHSALSVPESEQQDEDTIRLQLATENWDSPIVVTTTVQLLESLFSDRPSRVRKLHRLAGSVIILDEFQALPPGLLVPTMDVLRILATPVSDGGYGATVVLCTATQPSFDSPKLRSVLKDVSIREIVPHHAEHFAKLKRVKYDWRTTPISWDALADELRGLPSALTILNTRKDALTLLDILDGTNHLFHLSTLLCGAHRRHVLEEVRRRLDAKLPVVLVSTQVVECGVDFDFPHVFRAIGPLDRIVQAAGRCNRNFRIDAGHVVIFEPESGSSPVGPYKDATNMTRFVMNGRDSEELHTPLLYQTYFRRLFNDLDLDKRKVQARRRELNFPEVASAYRLINDSTSPVVVKYGEEWRQKLVAFQKRPGRKAWRGLQPFVVNLFDHDLRRYQDGLEEVTNDLKLWHGSYAQLRGIGLGSEAWDPSDLYVGGS